jgi:hypothetical protein
MEKRFLVETLMKLERFVFSPILAAVIGVSSLALAKAHAADPETKPPTASELASRLNTGRMPGTSYVRVRMDTGGTVLQLQVKERRTEKGAEMVYQVLFPKERKGEAVLLKKTDGQAPTGVIMAGDGKTSELSAAQMKDPFLGTVLTYEDMIENFFAWPEQAITGTEEVNRVKCPILESKPSKGDRSSYSKVRSWVDTRRMVPLRVEKHALSGEVAKSVKTTRVVTGPQGRPIPANLVVTAGASGATTEIDGSRIKHDVVYADDEFTPEGLAKIAAPKGSPE